jgi:hypothetical protein
MENSVKIKGCDKLYINQEELITRIVEKTHYTPDVVKEILNGCRKVIKDLMLINPKEDMSIDLWSGLKIKRFYEDESKLSGALRNLECTKKIKIKAIISHRFRESVNKAALGDKNK